MDNLISAMVRIANEAQASTSTHPRCVVLMRKLFDENEFDVFWEGFSRILTSALYFDYKKKVSHAKYFLDFAAIFCTSMERRNVPEDESIVETELLSTTLNYLLKCQGNANDNMRYHSCLFLNKILDNLVGAELSVELWDNIQECMLDRALDMRVAVRIQALTALYPLQCPDNPNCPVIKEYVTRIMNDPNANVRKLCIEKVALRRDVISTVIQQSMDVSDCVRIAVYNRALKFPQHFKIIERQTLLKNGMYGGSTSVEKFIKQQLLPAWLQHWDNDYLKLAKALRLDADFKDLEKSFEVIQYALKSLMRTRPRSEIFGVLQLDEKKCVIQSDLDWETIIFWRMLLEVMKDIDEYDAAEFMPSFIDFCEYIEKYNDSKKDIDMDDLDYLQYQYILNQLFAMVEIYDLFDVTCRNTLNQAISNIILTSNLQLEVIQTIINCLNYSLTNVTDMIRFVVELMSEIIYNNPEDNIENTLDNFELAQAKVKLYTLKHDQENAIREKDFLRAESLNKEIDEMQNIIDISREAISNAENAEPTKKTDQPTIMKYINVCIALLSCSKVRVFDDILRTLKDDMIQDLIMHENDDIRHGAFKSYALFCLLDEQNAKVGIHLFCATIEAYKNGAMRDVTIAVTAICAVVDFIRLFGADLMANPHGIENDQSYNNSFDEQQEAVFSGGSSLTNVIQILVDLMQDENFEIQEKSTSGLCKLLLAGRIQSASVVSRLIIKWASPATDRTDDSIIPQIIGITLEKLTQYESSNQIEQAVVPTIRTICKAPKTSPLADIDLNNLLKFLLSLCMSCSNNEGVQESLAFILCREILNNPKRTYNFYFSKLLIMLSMDQCNKRTLLELKSLCDEILDENSESKVLVNIKKFKAVLIDHSKDKTTISLPGGSVGSDDSAKENF